MSTPAHRRVFVHIGAPKTGTTYLQDRLSINARDLAHHGVHVPTGSPFVSPQLYQFRAALDLLEQDWGGRPGHAEGAWPGLVRQVRRKSGTVVISHEILAPAPPEKITRLVNDLHGSELHIVYSARDLVRQVPAAWQESLKSGRRWKYRRFLDRVERGDAWFMRAFDLPTVLNAWSRNLPPERVHVVTVPPAGAAPGELWLRFCRVFGIQPEWAPKDSERANASLGVAESTTLRRLNQRLTRQVRISPSHQDLIEDLLVRSGPTRARRKVELPPDRFAWAEEQAERWIDWIKGSGVDVVGDVEDLRPRPVPEGDWRDPDKVSRKAVANVAVDLLARLTTEAAHRNDSSWSLPSKVRRGARQLRQR